MANNARMAEANVWLVGKSELSNFKAGLNAETPILEERSKTLWTAVEEAAADADTKFYGGVGIVVAGLAAGVGAVVVAAALPALATLAAGASLIAAGASLMAMGSRDREVPERMNDYFANLVALGHVNGLKGVLTETWAGDPEQVVVGVTSDSRAKDIFATSAVLEKLGARRAPRGEGRLG